MLWTKEAPKKPGKYVARYMDETVGRMRYGTFTVYQYGGVGWIHFKRPIKDSEYGKMEFSKRIEGVGQGDENLKEGWSKKNA